LGTIFYPRALSFDIPASQEGVYLFYTPHDKFLKCIFVVLNKKKTSLIMERLRVISPPLASATETIFFFFHEK